MRRPRHHRRVNIDAVASTSPDPSIVYPTVPISYSNRINISPPPPRAAPIHATPTPTETLRRPRFPNRTPWPSHRSTHAVAYRNPQYTIAAASSSLVARHLPYTHQHRRRLISATPRPRSTLLVVNIVVAAVPDAIESDAAAATPSTSTSTPPPHRWSRGVASPSPSPPPEAGSLVAHSPPSATIPGVDQFKV
ncbi:unnamed protein product [Urochloa humidicola]